MSVTAETCGVFIPIPLESFYFKSFTYSVTKYWKMPIPSQDFEPGLDLGLDNFSLSRLFHLLQVT